MLLNALNSRNAHYLLDIHILFSQSESRVYVSVSWMYLTF